jgi:hypothetical protein
VLAHLDRDEKSNEIPAVLARLACADRLRGHCRCHALLNKAFEQAAAASVHLIAQVKANQPALHHAIAALCDTAAPVG